MRERERERERASNCRVQERYELVLEGSFSLSNFSWMERLIRMKL
jgi:hypothetical protein